MDEQRERVAAARPLEHAPRAYRDRLRRMRSPAARARTVAGLWLLEQALSAAGESSDAVQRIGFAAGGRPEIAGLPAFSISHSGALVACALADSQVGDQRIGLDVEQRRPIRPASLARLVSDADRAVVDRDPARFFDYWCAREATVKASGRVGLKRICELQLDGNRALLDGKYWPLRPLALLPGYAGCLASDRPIDTPTVERLELPIGE